TAIAAVVDVGLHAQTTAVDAASLETRLELPSRHLEPVLQALVRDEILAGRRGPFGGYRLARDSRTISVGEIARSWKSTTLPHRRHGSSRIISDIIEPALQEAGESFMAELGTITIEDLCS